MPVFLTALRRYEVWNAALASTLFTPENAGRPVYLDMDDDVLFRVSNATGVEQADAAVQLAATVRSTLD